MNDRRLKRVPQPFQSTSTHKPDRDILDKEKRAMKKNVIHPIPLVVGGSRLSEHTYRVDLGRTVMTCTYIWYIEGPKEKILVDAGVDAESFKQRGYPGRIDIQSPEQGLAKLGLKPEDIDLVLLTHLHFDHWMFASKFSRAKFMVQRAEVEYMKNPYPFEARKGLTEEAFSGIDLKIVEGDCEVGNGVKLLFSPGHTAGGQSVAVDTVKGMAIIDGMCAVPENFYPPDEIKNLVPVIPSMIHLDLRQAFESLLRIKKLADVIVPLHNIRSAFAETIP
jgi:glyoxylase-like metal-dependent hydrolase (beta-lactamase superfamily II)